MTEDTLFSDDCQRFRLEGAHDRYNQRQWQPKTTSMQRRSPKTKRLRVFQLRGASGRRVRSPRRGR